MTPRPHGPDHLHAPAYWSREAVIPGIYAIAPMLPGTLAFGLAFGALCAQKKFTLGEVEDSVNQLNPRSMGIAQIVAAAVTVLVTPVLILFGKSALTFGCEDAECSTGKPVSPGR